MKESIDNLRLVQSKELEDVKLLYSNELLEVKN